MRYVHTNIIAEDWKALSAFYQKVFGCRPVGPRRDLRGEWLDQMTGIPGSHLVGEHLRVPGYGEELPTLEIYSYVGKTVKREDKQVNHTGFAHVAFEVDDVHDTVKQVLAAGGGCLGEIVQRQYPELGFATFAYVRDIEGNIVEVQNWDKRKV